MKKMTAFGLAAALSLASISSSLAAPITGSLNIKLDRVSAVNKNGTPNPAKDAACQEKYKSLVGVKVSGQYSIDKSTGIMAASADVLGVSTPLHPLGIQGKYDFMSDGVPKELSQKGINREVLDMNEELTKKSFSILADFDADGNCVISGAQ